MFMHVYYYNVILILLYNLLLLRQLVLLDTNLKNNLYVFNYFYRKFTNNLYNSIPNNNSIYSIAYLIHIILYTYPNMANQIYHHNNVILNHIIFILIIMVHLFHLLISSNLIFIHIIHKQFYYLINNLLLIKILHNNLQNLIL